MKPITKEDVLKWREELKLLEARHEKQLRKIKYIEWGMAVSIIFVILLNFIPFIFF